MKHDKVVLGLSGGVDSTAAALLLKEQGYEVIALNFDVLGKGEQSSATAKMVADQLGLPFIYRNISEPFREKVISYFHHEYISGRTPNPCVMCNKEMKFQVLFEEAARQGARFVATGHYARVQKNDQDGLFYLKIAANHSKDQSYVLWRLSQNELSKILFPLGDQESKEQIRDILRKAGFTNAESKDSQEICFVENNHYLDFLKKEFGLLPQKGKFIDQQERVLGEHQGIVNYTIGQRKGLGITFGKPVFVTRIDAEKNQILLGEDKDLLHQTISISNYHFCGKIPKNGTSLKGKIRYSAKAANCQIYIENENHLTVIFEQPQRAPTPGQSLVLYQDEDLIGGGIIEKY